MSRDPMKPLDDYSRDAIQTANQGLNDVKDRVSDMTSKVKDKAGQVAETVSEKLGQQRTNAADTLGRAASALHERASDVPGGPKAVNLTHSIADGMESTASYLRGHDFSQMGKDVVEVCRRHPAQSLVAALALGFFIGRSRR
jgi:membrane-bound lytic murein transglycosylase B